MPSGSSVFWFHELFCNFQELEKIDEIPSELFVSLPERSSHTDEDVTKIICVLCMDTASNLSVTQCGHVFCWQCIMKWCVMKVIVCSFDVFQTSTNKKKEF